MSERTSLWLLAGALAPLTVSELADVLGCRPEEVRAAVADYRWEAHGGLDRRRRKARRG